jgi:hypothetical protein
VGFAFGDFRGVAMQEIVLESVIFTICAAGNGFKEVMATLWHH